MDIPGDFQDGIEKYLKKHHTELQRRWPERMAKFLIRGAIGYTPFGAWYSAYQADQQEQFQLGIENRMTDLEKNLWTVVAKVLSLLGEHDPPVPENLDMGKISQILEAARHESEEYMQNEWAKLLSGELEKPGSFSRASVNMMRNMDTMTARDFGFACEYLYDVHYVRQGGGTTGPISTILLCASDAVEAFRYLHNEFGMSETFLKDLHDIGLVRYEYGHSNTMGFGNFGQGVKLMISREGHRTPFGEIESIESGGYSSALSGIALTKVGQELSRLCRVKYERESEMARMKVIGALFSRIGEVRFWTLESEEYDAKMEEYFENENYGISDPPQEPSSWWMKL